MRKNAAKFIKKTEYLLHRTEGTYTITLPAFVKKENVTSMKIFGNYKIGLNFAPEGVGNYDSISENYLIPLYVHDENSATGQIANLYIEKPLLRIGSTMDEADIALGILRRKIHHTELNQNSQIVFSGIDGIYQIYLPKRMAEDKPCLCSYEKMSLSDLEYYDSGVVPGEGGNFIYIKDTERFGDYGSLISQLEEEPIHFSYVLHNYETETVTVNIPYRLGATVIETETDVKPRKFYAEYY